MKGCSSSPSFGEKGCLRDFGRKYRLLMDDTLDLSMLFAVPRRMDGE